MASAAIFASLRRRRMPSLETFLVPVDLTAADLIESLISLSSELISSFSYKTTSCQTKNARSLLRKIHVFSVLLDSLKEFLEVPNWLECRFSGSTLLVCLKELYLVLYRSKILLDYCSQSSKLWLLLQNCFISGHFHDLDQEICTLLDVLPVSDLDLPYDVKEQVELLRKQSRKPKLFIDRSDEMTRSNLYLFLNEFENGSIPSRDDLYSIFVDRIGLRNARSCNAEIEFLEEQIVNHEGDLEPNAVLLNGVVAIVRYCRYLFYGLEVDEMVKIRNVRKVNKGGVVSREIAETFIKVPKDFCCPVTLDLMRDPVVVCTGQTYEKDSITRWIDEGHHTCPKTGQFLVHRWVIPNRSLRNMIMQWCAANGIPYDPSGQGDFSSEALAVVASGSKAALEANKATARLLIEQLANGTQSEKTIAARAVRLLAKNGKEDRAYIAEAGAIPHLRMLLSPEDAATQENSITAILNLSIHDMNKGRIMLEKGCLGSIVEVLRCGLTTEARENAAATLFSLSAVHDFKKRIADEEGAVEALTSLLKEGTPRGQKDAVTALFNLSTHTDNYARMIESGGVIALVDVLECENVCEEAAGALALIVRLPIGAEAVGKEEKAVTGLIEMMRSGSPKGKENAVAALLELSRNAGTSISDKVLKAPALASLLQSLFCTGTRRARRKAASLARVFQRLRSNTSSHLGYPIGIGYMDHSATVSTNSSMTPEFSLPFSISVRVL
ncbi:ubiquitin-protein ligase [Lithospermum erythrorhizon]|uniref:RING-type E3 ubiquitin transferase n=1 Tax=Lithospermum erythrorhizon TaxID=34254 RepID=A0AAV3PIZ2_LITER